MNILEMAAYIARATYTDEFCEICGKAIAIDEVKTTITTEKGESKLSYSVHTDGGAKNVLEKTWTYPANLFISQ